MIAFRFRAVEIIQKAAPTADHRKKTTAGGEILDGILQVGGQMIDSLGEKGNLHIGRARILFVKAVASDDLAFRSGGHELRRNSYANGFPSQCRKMDIPPTA